MHQTIYLSSYISIPILFILLVFCFAYKKKILRSKKKLLLILSLVALNLIFIYARFIEPNIILENYTGIKVGFKTKIVVISDLHLGVYKGKDFLSRVVTRINLIKEKDAVIIPGDLVYFPDTDLDELFSPLKGIDCPVYAVLGNHDSYQRNYKFINKLKDSLVQNNVVVLENESIKLKNINILGLGDHWSIDDDISKINEFSIEDNLIVITHNPDTTLMYKNSIADLTISGHTHGGQIFIPFIYKFFIPCKGDFEKGLYENLNGKVFVSSGIGETALPMRFGVPPVIDILNLY